MATLDRFRISAPNHRDGPAQIFYRPEDLILGRVDQPDGPERYRATVHEITPTVPLARVSLGPSPELTALIHRQDLLQLDLRRGDTVSVVLASAAVRLWSV
jgi:hypothetical protein